MNNEEWTELRGEEAAQQWGAKRVTDQVWSPWRAVWKPVDVSGRWEEKLRYRRKIERPTEAMHFL